MRKFLSALLLGWGGVGFAAPAQEFVLDNGMKVIVKTDKIGGQSFQARLAPLN